MQKITHIASLVLLGIFLIPQSTFAYVTTGHSATKLGESAYLYTVTYQFGSDSYDVRLPVHAIRNLDPKNTAAVGYNILANGGLRTLKGTTHSIVLSDASVENGEYVVEKGQAEQFTLVAFLILPEKTSTTTIDYDLKVSSLPFTMVVDGVEIPGHLNDSELDAYATNAK